MLRIAIIGGHGFVGRNLYKKLAQKHDTRVFDVVDDTIDVTNEKTFSDFVDFDPEIVYFLAAKMRMGDFVPDCTCGWNINVNGLINTLQHCVKLKSFKKIIFSSTVHVYAGTHDTHVDENTSIDSVNNNIHPYALSKITGESIIKSFHLMHGIKYTILRFGVIVGPDGHSDMVVHSFISQALSHKVLNIQGDGETHRCFVFIDDVVDCLRRVISAGDDQTYNCCYNKSVTINNIVEVLSETIPVVNVVYNSSRPGDFSCPHVDNTKALVELNWQPRISFKSAVSQYKKWCITNKYC